MYVSAGLRGGDIKKQIKRFYDVSSPHYLRLFGRHIHDGYYISGRESRNAAQVNLIKMMADRTGIKTRDSVLDVGCGMGGSSVWLAENLQAVTTGINISPVQLGLAEQLARERGVSCRFLLMNAETMEFPCTFDVIWVLAAITHFRDQAAFLERATRFLNRGGKLVMFDWMLANRGVRPDDRLIKQVRNGMLTPHLYPPDTYQSWLADTGFRLTCCEDTTARTIRTWDVAMEVITQPSALKLVFRYGLKEQRLFWNFLQSLRAIRTAMRRQKIISMFMAAQKL